MICYNCNATMTDHGGGFHECPRCGDIFDNTYIPTIEIYGGPIVCPRCNLKTLWEKDQSGYPGLFHCSHCGIWLDAETDQGWEYRGWQAEHDYIAADLRAAADDDTEGGAR